MDHVTVQSVYAQYTLLKIMKQTNQREKHTKKTTMYK